MICDDNDLAHYIYTFLTLSITLLLSIALSSLLYFFFVFFLPGDCHPVARMWRAEYMPGWNADLTVGPYDHVLKASLFADRRDGGGGGDRVEGGSRERTTMRGRRDGGEPVQVRRELCEQWVDHPVLVQQRDTFANFFHDR